MSARRPRSGVLGLLPVAVLATVLLYFSRYWPFRLWSDDGLLGLSWLPPEGNVLAYQVDRIWQLTGIWQLGALDIVVWGIACFIILSGLDWLWTRFESMRKGRGNRDNGNGSAES